MNFSRKARIYIIAMFILAVSVAVVCNGLYPVTGLGDYLLWLVFTLMIAVSDHFPVQVRPGWSLELDLIPTAAAILLFPPGVVLAICGLGILAGSMKPETDWQDLLFNLSQKLVTAGAATLSLHLISPAAWSPAYPLSWLAAAAASMVIVLVRSLLVGGMASIQQGSPWFREWSAGLERSLGAEAVLIVIGVLAAMIIAPYPWALILVLAAAGGIHLAITRLHQSYQQQEILVESHTRKAETLQIYVDRLKKSNEELQAVASINLELRKAQNRAELIALILEQACRHTGTPSGLISLRSADSGSWVVESARGSWSRSQGMKIAPASPLAGRNTQPGMASVIPDLRHNSQPVSLDWIDGDCSAAGVPLAAQGETFGMLWTGKINRFEPDELHKLVIIADSASSAIHRTGLFDQISREARRLAAENAELAKAYEGALESWARALELRGFESPGHSGRVTALAARVGLDLGMNNDQLAHLKRGALLHDIGKLGVPEQILTKAGPLNDEEWAAIRRHPQIGSDLLAPNRLFQTDLDVPYCHHERWDGTGYPRGLKGERIPLSARIFAVVDVYDSLTHDRPYRPAWSPEKTLEYIRKASGQQFDPQVVEKFLMILEGGPAVPEINTRK